MSNHCYNRLYVPKDKMPAFIQSYIKDGIFDFESIIPIGDVPDWFEQACEKWGTGEDTSDYDLYVNENYIEFYTKWTPPIPIIRKLAELHKDTVFRLDYFESGVGFWGIVIAEWQDDEVLLLDDCWEITDRENTLIDLQWAYDRTGCGWGYYPPPPIPFK